MGGEGREKRGAQSSEAGGSEGEQLRTWGATPGRRGPGVRAGR